MFIGEYSYTIDDKGRINLPAKFRNEFKKGVVITRGLDSCLFVYTDKAWQELASHISKLSITDKGSRAFSRLMLAGAWDTKLDSQGRIILPEYLRQFAKIGKHAIIAGLYDRLEIWDEDSWQNYSAINEKNSEEIAQSLSDLNI